VLAFSVHPFLGTLMLRGIKVISQGLINDVVVSEL